MKSTTHVVCRTAFLRSANFFVSSKKLGTRFSRAEIKLDVGSSDDLQNLKPRWKLSHHIYTLFKSDQSDETLKNFLLIAAKRERKCQVLHRGLVRSRSQDCKTASSLAHSFLSTFLKLSLILFFYGRGQRTPDFPGPSQVRVIENNHRPDTNTQTLSALWAWAGVWSCRPTV